jgi:hypothetical protein
MTTTTVCFPNRNPAAFIRDMKRQVAEFFEARGGRTKGDWRMVTKTIILLGVYFGAYALILAGGLSPLAMLGLCVVMGVGMAGIGFAVAHDALHGAYSDKAWVNRVVGYAFDILGANGYMWRMTHNIVHHTYTNIQGVDGDLEVSPYLRLSPRSAWRPIHRFQQWYAFAAYSLSTLVWVTIKDWKYFLRKDGGPYHSERHPPRWRGGRCCWAGWRCISRRGSSSGSCSSSPMSSRRRRIPCRTSPATWNKPGWCTSSRRRRTSGGATGRSPGTSVASITRSSTTSSRRCAAFTIRPYRRLCDPWRWPTECRTTTTRRS